VKSAIEHPRSSRTSLTASRTGLILLSLGPMGANGSTPKSGATGPVLVLPSSSVASVYKSRSTNSSTPLRINLTISPLTLARKLFTAPTMWAYDLSRFMYGALFMLGAGYALSKGVHIRADFLYRNFKTKTQGLIDFWLYLLFYFPGLIVFLWMTTGFVQESIMRGERGMDTTWMPYMWPIKSCLLVGIVFLLIQGISELLKSYWAATRGKWPGEDE